MLLTHGAVHRPATPHTPERDHERITALELAHARLQLETQRSQRLGDELIQAQAMLERVQADLASALARERRALHLANHDGLTTLPNRRAFLERLHAALQDEAAGTAGLAVLFMDLDRFKQVNDSHGHAAGDELLRIVASRLLQAVRGRDAVGRLGGDEFACLLRDAPSRQKVARVAGKLLQVVGAPTTLGASVLSIRPSIGIALFRAGDGFSGEQLMQQADRAMYAAKRQQCGFAFFQPGDGALAVG